MSEQELIAALDHLRAGSLKPGPEMEAAHEICQRYEGTAPFDWIHALVHRIEGDQPNADYWYRRAGRPRHPGSIEDEWETIRRSVEGI